MHATLLEVASSRAYLALAVRGVHGLVLVLLCVAPCASVEWRPSNRVLARGVSMCVCLDPELRALTRPHCAQAIIHVIDSVLVPPKPSAQE